MSDVAHVVHHGLYGSGEQWLRKCVHRWTIWKPRWIKGRPTVSLQWRISELSCAWALTADAWLIHLCWLLFIGDEGWNFHASNVTRFPLNGDRLFFQVNHILSIIWQRHIGPWNVWKQTCYNCWKSPSWKKKQYGLGSALVGCSGFTQHCGMYDESLQICIYPCEPGLPLNANCFFLRIRASTIRTIRCIIKLAV